MSPRKKKGLIPPDPKQCQAEITEAYNPFAFRPMPRPKRCENAPRWIASDGIGSMSLCESCLNHCLLQHPGTQAEPIK